MRTAISHVTLRVNDLERVSEFYRTIVGLELLAGDRAEHRLGTAEGPLLTLVGDPPAPAGAGQPGLYHTAFRLPDRRVLGAWLQRYAEHDAEGFQGASDHGVSEALYLSDPEGNGVEVYADRPEDTWEVGPGGEVSMYVRPLDLDELIRSAGKVARGAESGVDIGHVHLQVRDLAASRTTFVDVLGLNVTSAFRESALFLSYDGYHHHVAINTWQPGLASTRDPAACGLVDVTIALPGTVDAHAVRSRADEAGVPVVATADAIALTDASGVVVHAR